MNGDALPRLRPHLRALQQVRPDVDLRLGVEDDLVDDLDRGRFDAVVVWWVEAGREGSAARLVEEDLVAVVPVESDLAGHDVVPPEHLSAAGSLVLFDPREAPTTYAALCEALRVADHDPRVLTPSSRGHRGRPAMIRSAAETRAATVVPAFNWSDGLARDGLVARPVALPAAPISLVRREDLAAGRDIAAALRALDGLRPVTPTDPDGVPPDPAGDTTHGPGE